MLKIFQYLVILQNGLYLSYSMMPLKLVSSAVLIMSSVFKGQNPALVAAMSSKPRRKEIPSFPNEDS